MKLTSFWLIGMRINTSKGCCFPINSFSFIINPENPNSFNLSTRSKRCAAEEHTDQSPVRKYLGKATHTLCAWACSFVGGYAQDYVESVVLISREANNQSTNESQPGHKKRDIGYICLGSDRKSYKYSMSNYSVFIHEDSVESDGYSDSIDSKRDIVDVFT